MFGESFTIMTGKEKLTLKDNAKKAEYARFIVLLANNESQPIFGVDKNKLGKFLLCRKPRQQRDIGNWLIHKVNVPSAVTPMPMPNGDDWDLPGSVVSYDTPEAAMVARRMAPPQFDKDWEGGTNFRIYSFSLRYNELIEWQFRVFKNGRVNVRIPFVITPGGLPCKTGRNHEEK